LRVAEKLEKELKGTESVEIESLSDLKQLPEELWLLDVAIGIESVEKITGLERLQELKLVSLHDLDIGTELLLYKKIGKLKKVVIVAIPAGMELEKAVAGSREIIKKG
jgi:hypothetical protein